MSLVALAGWAFAVAAVAVLVELVVVVLGLVREARTIERRVKAMRLLSVAQVAAASDAVARLSAAAEAAPPLIGRATVAIGTLRRSPVPRSLLAAARAVVVSAGLLRHAIDLS